MSDPFYELSPVMQEVLAAGGTVKLKPGGFSMLPFIFPDRDEVILERAERKLRVGQIYLFQRDNGAMVLHRLVGFKNGNPVFRGDNQIRCEYGITAERVIARVRSLKKEDREIVTGSFTFWYYAVIAFPFCLCKRVLHRIFK